MLTWCEFCIRIRDEGCGVNFLVEIYPTASFRLRVECSLLTSMIHDLQEVIDQLDKENGAYVNEYFKEAGDYRNSVPDHSFGLFDKVHKLYVHIPDQPGTIATVTSFFGPFVPDFLYIF